MTDIEDTAALRADLFRESRVETMQRVLLRFAWALKHYHVALLPFAVAWFRNRLSPQTGLPHPARTGTDKEMAGFVHDLSVPALLAAYKRGLYTWTITARLPGVRRPNAACSLCAISISVRMCAG